MLLANLMHNFNSHFAGISVDLERQTPDSMAAEVHKAEQAASGDGKGDHARKYIQRDQSLLLSAVELFSDQRLPPQYWAVCHRVKSQQMDIFTNFCYFLALFPSDPESESAVESGEKFHAVLGGVFQRALVCVGPLYLAGMLGVESYRLANVFWQAGLERLDIKSSSAQAEHGDGVHGQYIGPSRTCCGHPGLIS
jgi:hypothetical protein